MKLTPMSTKGWSVVLCLAGLISGCATTYTVRSDNAPRMSLEEAKKTFQTTLLHAETPIRRVAILNNGSEAVLEIGLAEGSPAPITFHLLFHAMGDRIEVARNGLIASSIFVPVSAIREKKSLILSWWNSEEPKRCANALYRLAHSTPEEWAAMKTKEDAPFQAVVQSYRAQAVKPDLPEEARKYQIKAELAVDQKRVDDALNLYAQALAVAPWWPEGYFNRAMILADKGDFAEAISEMKKYLALAPDSPDARASQDHIYKWEELAK